MDDLEEDLTCSMCYSLFCDPRVLPCSHTFCKACLDSLLQWSVKQSVRRPLRLPLKCPNCRGVMELPPEGVEALPANVSLRAVIEKAGGTFQKDRHPAPPCCPDHQGQPLNIYCVQDCKLICGLCLTGCSWEQGTGACEGQVGADRLAVEQFFQGLELTLSKKKEAFLGALDTVSVAVSEAYDPLINRVKEMQEEQSVLVSLVSSMEEEDCPLVFLDQMHLFRRRVEALMDAPLPSAVALSVSPRAADYLQRHWPVVTIGGLDEAPIPTVCCCGDPGAVQEAEPWNRLTAAVAAVWDPERWFLVLGSTMLLILVVIMIVIWIVMVINPMDELQTASDLCQWTAARTPSTGLRDTHVDVARHDGDVLEVQRVQLEQGKARCEGQVGADRLAVEHFFQGLELTLSKKKEAFLGALDTVSVTVSEAYDPLINRVKEIQSAHALQITSSATGLS
ncbi:hypothetical protein CRUP_025080 [Coryphaenoides rupestris]|nr:hypothetical protein CRUP_025080 [Coryphaenoides rupestris]